MPPACSRRKHKGSGSGNLPSRGTPQAVTFAQTPRQCCPTTRQKCCRSDHPFPKKGQHSGCESTCNRVSTAECPWLSHTLLPPGQNQLAHDRLGDTLKKQQRRHRGLLGRVAFTVTVVATSFVVIPFTSWHGSGCRRRITHNLAADAAGGGVFLASSSRDSSGGLETLREGRSSGGKSRDGTPLEKRGTYPWSVCQVPFRRLRHVQHLCGTKGLTASSSLASSTVKSASGREMPRRFPPDSPPFPPFPAPPWPALPPPPLDDSVRLA